MKHKVLFLFWHGLGDHVLATPAIKAYRKKHPDHHIGFTILERFKSAQYHNPNVDQWHYIPDAWNDFGTPQKGFDAVERIARMIKADEGYHEFVIVNHKSSGKHKIHRTADEMGVIVEDVKTEFYFPYEPQEKMENDFFHGKTGVPNKDLDIDLWVFNPDKSVNANPNMPLWYWAEYLPHSFRIVVADSVYFHIACALGRVPDIAYFARGTEVFNVVKPLHLNVTPTYEIASIV